VSFSEPRKSAEGDALRANRDERQMHLVQVLVEENGDLQERPGCEPGDAHASVSLEAEQGAQALLPAPRRAQFDQEMRDLAADVPQAVRRARHDLEHLAGAERLLPTPDPEPQFAGHAFEALPLARVHMGRDEASGPDEELGCHAVGGPLAEDDRLARNGVRDCVYAPPDHPI
jgi:hypothetical protein